MNEDVLIYLGILILVGPNSLLHAIDQPLPPNSPLHYFDSKATKSPQFQQSETSYSAQPSDINPQRPSVGIRVNCFPQVALSSFLPESCLQHHLLETLATMGSKYFDVNTNIYTYEQEPEFVRKYTANIHAKSSNTTCQCTRCLNLKRCVYSVRSSARTGMLPCLSISSHLKYLSPPRWRKRSILQTIMISGDG
ncbi:hypothetical protein BDZ45DRAFT_303359 [Acephala macrosclerotiorum]|nr:hypothetical protein BDZ45DRAFT_303359 [Acephala macrosclerotiorum]